MFDLLLPFDSLNCKSVFRLLQQHKEQVYGVYCLTNPEIRDILYHSMSSWQLCSGSGFSIGWRRDRSLGTVI